MRATSTTFVLVNTVVASNRRPTWDSVRRMEDPYDDLLIRHRPIINTTIMPTGSLLLADTQGLCHAGYISTRVGINEIQKGETHNETYISSDAAWVAGAAGGLCELRQGAYRPVLGY